MDDRTEFMTDTRHCADCGRLLQRTETQALCPACIFRRLSSGATTMPGNDPQPSTALSGVHEDTEDDTDFLSEYELLCEIGRGGMGVIYKAHQPRLNRTVALKVLHAAGLAGEAARHRFQSEVKVAARLNHPNIVPVFDVSEMDGCPCFSMEYFPGGSLHDWMRGSKWPIDQGVRLMVKVAQAVFFAHQRGVLHRDLKPANILMDASEEPHVADFGLAKELNSSSHITHSGAVLGSPNYMSPEQASGHSESLTVATDIYSLGAILYEMLAGRPPFTAATPLETMRMVVEQDAPKPSTIAGRTDRDLEIICLKCLHKDPTRRYGTAADLAADLERWLRHEPIHASPISQSERFLKWVKRHPSLAALSALLFVVLVAGLTGVGWQWRKAEEARFNESLQLHRAEEALARSSLALAESALREGNSPAVLSALETVPSHLREGTWSYLHGEADTSRPLPDIGVKLLSSLEADPARASVFAAADRARGVIVVFNVRDGSRLLEFVPGFTKSATNVSLCLTITAGRIAVGRGGPGGLVVHDLNDGRKLMEWSAPPSFRLEFNRDASQLLQVQSSRRAMLLWDAGQGKFQWGHTNEYHAGHFTSDGDYIARYSWDHQLQLIRSSNGTTVADLSNNYFEQMATQPNGDLLVAANPMGYIRGFGVSDARRRFEMQLHESPIDHVTFLPGGERFLTAATLPDDRLALQCWDSASGRACQTLMGGSGHIDHLCLHPISGELIVSSRERRVWETSSLPPVRLIRGDNAHPSAVFWGSRDVMFGPGDGPMSADLQSFTNTQPTILWQAWSPDHGQPSVSADGRRAAIGRYNSPHHIHLLERDDAGNVREIASINPRGTVDYVRLSPTGDRVAIVHKNFTRVRIAEVPTGTNSVVLDVPQMKRFSDLVWLDGGKRLVGLVTTHAFRSTPGSKEEIALWDTATGALLHHVTNQTVLSVACPSPDGRNFVEAGMDRNVRLRDGTTLKVIREFRTHNAPLTALAWHPSRPIIATTSEDLLIRLWNVDNGTRLEELHGPLSPPSVLSFSPDGTRLATAARDRTARIWEPQSLMRTSLRK